MWFYFLYSELFIMYVDLLDALFKYHVLLLLCISDVSYFAYFEKVCKPTFKNTSYVLLTILV